MKYKNTKTGAIIDSPCKISGGDWIKYTGVAGEAEETVEKTIEDVVVEIKEEPNTEVTKEDATIDGVTKKQIIQELDAMGIEYDPRARKEELYNLMLGK